MAMRRMLCRAQACFFLLSPKCLRDACRGQRIDIRQLFADNAFAAQRQRRRRRLYKAETKDFIPRVRRPATGDTQRKTRTSFLPDPSPLVDHVNGGPGEAWTISSNLAVDRPQLRSTASVRLRNDWADTSTTTPPTNNAGLAS